MGLLDDAIREHLELKRRRGADAGEVTREEQEALGPVRREPTASAGSATEVPGDPVGEAAPTPLPSFADEPPPAGEPVVADLRGAAVPDPFPEEPELGEDPGDRGDPREDGEGPDLAPARGPGDGVRRGLTETEEWGFDDEEDEDADPDPEPAVGNEDVLEQTPEFLSETPEHDRLWFEQKPPRPFDFDG